jgi:hypothetical protein
VQAIGIVFGLWYTLICAEDHGLPHGGETGGITLTLTFRFIFDW